MDFLNSCAGLVQKYAALLPGFALFELKAMTLPVVSLLIKGLSRMAAVDSIENDFLEIGCA
ncbi:hypothetical protein PSQ39_01120 [Curvibacter sp. HBC28]|uniref:Uncharacterized protein n=1 Tax=Curvibacter microcysteis TaxID=3026419 RepID=A0ABT5M9G6_9BURK|nr:hypothetical protein [Curvibacter sp. HBC28]MDD0813221.1 hypothetical protein [Curvibacter sp. HBC28]